MEPAGSADGEPECIQEWLIYDYG